MANLPVVGLVSHVRQVQNLYKRALRNAESSYHNRHDYRYFAVHIRKRFEENRNIKDMNVARKLLAEAENEYFKNKFYSQAKFPGSPGGVAYLREVTPPDWVLDYWHPLEKAQYPDFFARREQRKKEFIKQWDKKYGKTKPIDSH